MDIKDYKFNVGDKVITVYGERGEITSICTCEHCEERGFYEPSWVSEDGRGNYISKWDAKHGFLGYYQIGEYRFNDFDKTQVWGDIVSYEKEIVKLRKQLAVIENIEGKNDCPYCKNGTYRKPIHRYDGTLVRKVNFCDECGRDLRHL